MKERVREPDSSSPFSGYVWNESRPGRATAADGDGALPSASDERSQRIGSLADFSSELGADPLAREAARTTPPLSPPSPLQQRPLSNALTWLAVLATGAFMGAGYSLLVRRDAPSDQSVALTDSKRPIDSSASVAKPPSVRRAPLARPPTNAAPRSTSTRPALKGIDTPARSSARSATAAAPIAPLESAPPSPGSEVLTPSAIAALPHVPVARPLTPSAPVAETPEEPEGIREQRVIRSLLDAYRLAYERLDALAVSALWPGVDSRSITRAFDTLIEQKMTFDRCTITITGTVAIARCDGTLAYSRRIGDHGVQSRRMTWAFALERASGQWRISGISAR